jgi:hypothetical protein
LPRGKDDDGALARDANAMFGRASLGFDREIIVYKNGLKGKRLGDLVNINTPSDNDQDSSTTSSTLKTETVGTQDYSSLVKVSGSGNKVTITLAADSSLIDGIIDTDDDLSYVLQNILLSSIMIKDAQSTYDRWSGLNGSPIKTTVLIRGKYP